MKVIFSNREEKLKPTKTKVLDHKNNTIKTNDDTPISTYLKNFLHYDNLSTARTILSNLDI